MSRALCHQPSLGPCSGRNLHRPGPTTRNAASGHSAVSSAPPAQQNIVMGSAAPAVSAHPDAVRRRQEAARRKAAAKAQVELVMKAAWWEGPSTPNLWMPDSPAQLRQAVETAGSLLVVDFFTSWCTACRRLYPKLRQIAENNPDVVFVKVNAGVDSLREMAESMGITQLPYFQFYKRGELVTQFPANLTRVNRLRAEIAANKDCNANDACVVA